ncbi:MAG TPA: crosslink repair DNA glycosylase YcaQ family protein, partial [Acidimicrobiales bacterium]|nr:crosslink repair DNA glycosylase YcaQ family protein [Acidimicrobiales bacterium]
PRGPWWRANPYRWARLADWAPAAVVADDTDTATARAELVRWWLRSFGPGTLDDVVWWTGWTKTATRAAVRAVDAVEVDLDGEVGLLLPDDLDTASPADPWVALLPALDPTAMGWKGRGWYLGSHRGALFDRNGNVGPTVWSDGRIVGGWAQRPDGQVVHRLLEDLGTETRAAVDDAAARVADLLGEARVVPRFRTPLERELTAG